MNSVNFEYNGKLMSVAFRSSYDGKANYDVTSAGMERVCFEVEFNKRVHRPLVRYSQTKDAILLCRAAYAALRRALHNDYIEYSRKNGFKNVGAMLRYARS